MSPIEATRFGDIIFFLYHQTKFKSHFLIEIIKEGNDLHSSQPIHSTNQPS